MTARLTEIRVYPVKSLTGHALDRVEAAAGQPLPGDRRFAIAHGAARLGAEPGAWAPKRNFLVLMTHARLAEIEARYDAATGRLTLRRDGQTVAEGDLASPDGRAEIERFFAVFLGEEARGMPRLVEASDGTYADRPRPFVSILNRASVADLERRTGLQVDIRRFRGNLVIDDAPAWAENEWVGREVTLGGARLRIVERIGRCAATDVNPETAERDIAMVRTLAATYGHTDCGVMATVEQGGAIAVGDRLEV